jgi:hypothetical protein
MLYRQNTFVKLTWQSCLSYLIPYFSLVEFRITQNGVMNFKITRFNCIKTRTVSDLTEVRRTLCRDYNMLYLKILMPNNLQHQDQWTLMYDLQQWTHMHTLLQLLDHQNTS